MPVHLARFESPGCDTLFGQLLAFTLYPSPFTLSQPM